MTLDRARLAGLRNYQSSEWYAALVIRPLTIAVTYPLADWRWVTPNRCTTAGNLAKLAAAALILSPGHWLLAAILLQVGVVFDHMDGMLARYRRTFTKLGSFYDKVSDMITWTAIMGAAGWQAARRRPAGRPPRAWRRDRADARRRAGGRAARAGPPRAARSTCG